MAIGKEIGEFSLKSISTSYAGDAGSVYVNLDGTAPPLADHLWPLTRRLADFELGSLRPFHSLVHGEVKANWKLVMENSLEPYHTPFVHGRTGAGIPLEDHHRVFGELPGSARDRWPPDHRQIPARLFDHASVR